MGDATIERGSGNSCLSLRGISKEFIKWVWDELGHLASRFQKSEGATKQIGKPVWEVRTRSHPELKEFENWYGYDGKMFPIDLELTPLITKVWYCCDGNLNFQSWDGKNYPRCSIGVSNEEDRENYLKTLFDKIGFEIYLSSPSLFISSSQTEEFLEWMGEPLPGFEYKWEYGSKSQYVQKKKCTYE